MTQRRWVVPTLVTGLLLAGPVGMASADDGQPSPASSSEPSSEPSPAPSPASSSAPASASSSPDGSASQQPSPAASETTTAPSPTPSPTPAANEPPVANNDSATVDAGRAVVIDVLANDRNEDGLPQGSTLAVDGVTGSNGRFSSTGTSVTFTARITDAGKYTGTYSVTDGELVAEGTITVRVRTKPSVWLTLPSAPVALRRYAVSGRVLPNGPSARATVTVQRWFPDGWRRYAVTRAGRDGRWSVPFRTNRPGAVVFRATTTLVDGRRATSGVLRRTVVARADAQVSGPLTAGEVPYSWRSGCPVSPAGLRKVTINRLTYSRTVARGTIVVRASAAPAIVGVFTAALDRRFPVRMMKPTDAFYAGGRRTPMESDKAAMRAGNTSAFNCRPVTGNPYRVSQHSYGNAIDINTIENPYVTGSHVYPATSRSYLDRSPYRRGMILPDGVVAARMRAHGWLWGARWSHPDYQHFSSNGG